MKVRSVILAVSFLAVGFAAQARSPLSDAPDYFLDYTCSGQLQAFDGPQIDLISTGAVAPESRYIQLTNHSGDKTLLPLKVVSFGTGALILQPDENVSKIEVTIPDRDLSVATVKLTDLGDAGLYQCTSAK